MHKYLRAIGFSNLQNRKEQQKLLADVVRHSTRHAMTVNTEEAFLGEFCKDFTDRIGIAVCGEFDEEEKFIYEYYFPYVKGTGISSYGELSVERHAEKHSYAGVCDEMKLGINLIFYLQNRIPFVKAEAMNLLPIKGTTVTLSGLSLGGTILLPIMKDEEQVNRVKQRSVQRIQLMEEARNGNEEAIETLTLEDMDTISVISHRIQREDILSIVDTYFMPYGIECDQYSLMGEITEVCLQTNPVTGETVYLLSVCSNDLTFDICINTIDLVGEPKVGRRFKGTVWLQGFINYPDEEMSL